MKNNKLFSTSELPLSAFLILNQFELLKVDKERQTRAIFHFRDKAERSDLVLRYFGKRATVEPASFLEEIRNLKGLVNN